MGEEKKGIKETSELVDGLGVIAVCVKKAYFDDKKINFADVPDVINAIKDPKLLAAIEGINDVDDELRDLSTEEVMALGYKLVEIVKLVKNA